MKSTEKDSTSANYQVFLIDNDLDNNILSSLLPMKAKAVELSFIPNDESIEMYFANQSMSYQEQGIHALYVSCDPEKLVIARNFDMDTCFLNNGINDFLDFDKNYEIPVKKLTK